MKLVSVDVIPQAAPVLFDLLAERPSYAWISHGVMPSRSEHETFVQKHPFRFWYLIEVPTIDVETHGVGGYAYAGALECTFANEIGVHILRRYQRHGYGEQALKLFLGTHLPLPPVKAVRNGNWLVNIATTNTGAKAFFGKVGFKPLQETWML